MPEASKSNIHGLIHGNCEGKIYNAGGVEELQIYNFNPLRGW